MSVKFDLAIAETGTRFRIFPQPRYLQSFKKPEVVVVSVPPNEIKIGPSDDRMFVVDAVNKQAYDEFSGPPYNGEKNPGVKPGPDGHFDKLDPDSRAFACATMYATVRRVLDIWQDYFGKHIPWHFEADFARMEMIPLIEWDNAQSGYGFLEFGYGRTPVGGIDHARPYCENFDVLAHELGHSIIFSQVGLPQSQQSATVDYGGFHESSGDLTAIVASMHFNSVIDHLLDQTKGNLFTVNELDRVGELSASREIRVAFNSKRLPDVGNEPHDRSLPLTGGIFDIMVEVFQKNLVAKNLISADLAKRSTQGPGGSPDTKQIQKEFNAAYKNHEAAFKQALLAARDYLGKLLATTWSSLDPNFLTYANVVKQLLAADRAIKNENQDTIRSCFQWRGITAPASMLLSLRSLTACGYGALRDHVPERRQQARASVEAYAGEAKMPIKAKAKSEGATYVGTTKRGRRREDRVD